MDTQKFCTILLKYKKKSEINKKRVNYFCGQERGLCKKKKSANKKRHYIFLNLEKNANSIFLLSQKNIVL